MHKNLIPSKTFRNYCNEKKIKLSSRNMATLIFNSPLLNWKEKIEELNKLSSITKENNLKTEINNRIQFEKEKYKVFTTIKDPNLIYSVSLTEDDPAKAYFDSYKLAKKYANTYLSNGNVEYVIGLHRFNTIKDKHLTNKEIREMDCNLNKNRPSEIKEAIDKFWFCNYPLGFMEINIDNKIKQIYGMHYLIDNDYIDEEGYLKDDTFEDEYIDGPFPFKDGEIVNCLDGQNINRDLCYGVVYSEGYTNKTEKQNLSYLDYQTTVYFLRWDGRWIHEHINPVYLDKANLDYYDDDLDKKLMKNALESFSCCIQEPANEKFQKQLFYASKEFAIKNTLSKNKTHFPESLEDIIC